jgi:hypothetical protein
MSNLMETISNKEFSERFNEPLTKVRRWVREFLPPDPIAKRRSGISRHMTITEAYEVFWGKELVVYYGFTVLEAKTIIKDLKQWLIGRHSLLSKSHRKGRKGEPYAHYIHVGRVKGIAGFNYKIREQLDRSTKWDGGVATVEERYRVINLEKLEGQLPVDRFLPYNTEAFTVIDVGAILAKFKALYSGALVARKKLDSFWEKKGAEK